MMCYLLTTATVLFCVGKIIHLQITDSIHTILFVVFFCVLFHCDVVHCHIDTT